MHIETLEKELVCFLSEFQSPLKYLIILWTYALERANIGLEGWGFELNYQEFLAVSLLSSLEEQYGYLIWKKKSDLGGRGSKVL